MEHRETSEDRWVSDRLAMLNSTAWESDSARALAKLREREIAARRKRHQWLWVTAAASAAGLLLLVLPDRLACATPRGCVDSSHVDSSHADSSGIADQPVQPDAPQSVPAQKSAQSSPAMGALEVLADFKHVGSPSAPVSCEIYFDLQCPPCKKVFHEIASNLISDYVQSGKVRITYRDFPLGAHAYAHLAARYAGAAGRIGQYERALNAIFDSQETWKETGDLDSALAAVLTPESMQQVRALLQNDSRLDAEIAADVEAARENGVTFTPALVLTAGKNRQVLPAGSSWDSIKAELDRLLGR